MRCRICSIVQRKFWNKDGEMLCLACKYILDLRGIKKVGHLSTVVTYPLE